MISVEGVSRSYDDGTRGVVRVLDAASLQVEQGEFLAVVGRSGSGKSTLLHVLGGLDSGFTGSVTVAGTKLARLDDRALSMFRSKSIGFVFQSFHLVPGLSALDNVSLPSAFGDGTEPAAALAEEALKRVGLTGKFERSADQLSGGERQRVAIARALYRKPPLLLCDEPTGNLDAQTADDIIGLFRQLNSEGVTVVVVTHEERLRQAARRVVTLTDGKLS